MGHVCSLKEPCESISLEPNETHEENLPFFGDCNALVPQASSRARAVIFARVSSHLLDQIFSVSGQLGTGTYGTVYKAGPKNSIDLQFTQAAVKTFSKPQLHPRDVESHHMWRVRCGMFHEERMVLAGLEHPHITQLCGSFMEESALHLVMEICDGGDLFSCINQCVFFAEARAQVVFWQMVSVTSYLHRLYVIHRDMKPENWLFTDRDADTVKLCDFGSAVQLSGMRPRTRNLGGTIVYQAPEIHMGRGSGAFADDWGLGAVLYTMLVGAHPFKQAGATDAVCVDKICQGAFNQEHSHWISLSEGAKYLVEQFLMVDENERMSCTESFTNDWVALGAPRSHTKGGFRLSAAKALQLAKIVSGLDELQRLVLVVCARLPCKATASAQRSASKNHAIPWYALFVHLDRDCDGRLSKKELREGLAQLMGPSMQDDEVITALDVDNNGFIDWAEWCMLALLEAISSDSSSLLENDEPWRSAHRLLDGPTGDGLISSRDFFSLPGLLGEGGREAQRTAVMRRWASGMTEDGSMGLKVSDLQRMFSSIAPLPELVIM